MCVALDTQFLRRPSAAPTIVHKIEDAEELGGPLELTEECFGGVKARLFADVLICGSLPVKVGSMFADVHLVEAYLSRRGQCKAVCRCAYGGSLPVKAGSRQGVVQMCRWMLTCQGGVNWQGCLQMCILWKLTCQG